MRVEDDAPLAQAEQPGHHLGRDVVGPQAVDDDHELCARRRRLSGHSRDRGECNDDVQRRTRGNRRWSMTFCVVLRSSALIVVIFVE